MFQSIQVMPWNRNLAPVVTTVTLKFGLAYQKYLYWLQILTLGRNQMTTIGSHKITLLKKLDKLDLSYNKLKGPIPKWLAGITLTGAQYGELDLDHNQFSGPIPGELCNIKPGLHVLGLTGNKLSGPIPASIGNCAQLQSLYVSGNALSGPLPHTLGKLKNLSSLSANHNRITGPLPVELGDLPNLREIDLDHNKLTGRIPSNYGPYTTDFPLAGLFTNNMLTGDFLF